MIVCSYCGRPTLHDVFSGEGGAGEGYRRAGFCVSAIDNDPARLAAYRLDCPGARKHLTDAIEFIIEHGHEAAVTHTSPPCTGYTRGTVALPDRLTRYSRLIAATREALQMVGGPYIIENVAGARAELETPIMLCGRMFGLTAVDEDGTPLVMDRHRLFESNVALMSPEHPPHDRSLQVAGAYGGARRDKVEARTIRKGGYVPGSLDVLRALLDTPWMSEKGCFLSIPPVYTEHIGEQLLAVLASQP